MEPLRGSPQQNIADEPPGQLLPEIRQRLAAPGETSHYPLSILVAGILMLACMWLFIYYHISGDYDRTIAETYRETSNLAQAFEEHVRRVVNDADEKLITLKRAYERDGIGSPVFDVYPLTSESRLIHSMIVIADERGRILTSFYYDFPGGDISGREYFQAHRSDDSGTLFIGAPIVGKLSSKDIIPISRRLNKPDGAFGGIVYIGLRVDYFLSFYRNIDLGRDQVITLSGKDGIIRARLTGDGRTFNYDAKEGQSWRNYQEGQTIGSYIAKSVVDGKERVMSHRAMADYPLVVLVGKSLDEALAGHEKRKQNYIGGGVSISLLIVLAALMLVNRFQTIQQSEDRFRKVFHHSPAMMVIFNMADNRCIEVNEKYLDVFGYRREDVVGRISQEHLRFEVTPEEVRDWLSNLRKTGEAPVAEYKVRTKTGNKVDVLLNATLINLGNKICRVTIMQDITAEKRMEQDRAQTQRRLQTFFSNCPAAVVVYWQESGKMIDMNPAFEQLYGCSRAAALGRSRAEIGIHETPVPDEKAFRGVRRKAGDVRQEVDVTLSDGRRLNIISLVTALDGDAAGQAMAYIIDITELRRMEAELARMDRINLVGEMAAGIGHEVRNPMTTVRGFLQLFERQAEFSRYNEQIKLMIEELDRANTIITEYLSLAKNKASDLGRGNLNDALNALFPLLQADGLESGHTVELRTNPVPDILFDPKELRQLVLNLVRNGMEATPPGGKVTIETFPEDDRVILAVQDNGGGIPEDVMKKLGTPFLTTKEHGTGLGLPVCYRIAQRHGAKIDVRTSPQGTKFSVIFQAV